LGEAYADEEVEEMLNSEPKGFWGLIEELEDEAGSVPLIAMVAFFALGLSLGFAVSKK